jgi:hypothetical protein
LCTVCNTLQYVATECTDGKDTICNSCENCDITVLGSHLEECSAKSYGSWSYSNCCKDEKGNKIACTGIDLANMIVAAKSGRHQWVFSTSVPPVVGAQYVFPKVY